LLGGTKWNLLPLGQPSCYNARMTEQERGKLEDQLRQAIAASDLAPAEIARQAGISRSFLSRFMSGERSISLAYAEQIAAVLGIRLTVKKSR
jgi:transcriptional regulator with XRE-family HTH domain